MGCNQIYRIILFAFMLMVSIGASAQLAGSFRVTNFAGDSISDGCSPLVVTFVDSSKFNGNPVPFVSIATGGSYNSHTWLSGAPLSNPFTIYRPNFVYSTPGTYTVTLIVSANGITFDTIRKQITVHPVPTIGFYATPLNGCSPLTVTFYDTSANTTGCTWSMGDGTVYTSQCTVTHTFNQTPGVTANCFDVTLIATNQFGCQASLTKNDYICIDPRPTAGFTVDNRIVCDSPFTVNFTDTSRSTHGMSYIWRFDHPAGNPSSALQNPSHTYPPGTNSYTVSLIVQDTVCGTRDTVVKTGYITTSNTIADFTASDSIICQGQSITFTPNITGPYTSVIWEFGPPGATSPVLSPTYIYNTPGVFNVRLRVFTANGCEHDTTYVGLITVRPRPTADFDINPDPATSCQAPFAVSFIDQSVGAVSWTWYFQHPSVVYTTNQQNPTYTYTTSGNFSVSLLVENSFGCQASIVYPNIVQIAPTVVDFVVDTPTGCAPLVVDFTDASTTPANNPIIGWTWDFGDNSPTTNVRNPSHTYAAVGVYDACLTIVTQSGCRGTKCTEISVGNPPVASFSIVNPVVCVGQAISFINQSTGVINQTVWTFGYPGGLTSSANNPPPFAFDEPGVFDIHLSVGQNGCFDDTVLTVTVLPPQADFDVTVNCSAPGTLTFVDLSIGADTYLWDFGDGIGTSTLPSPVYTYANSGTYTVNLTVTNLTTNCTHEYEEEIEVSVLNSDFRANRYFGCAPVNINFFSNSTGSGITQLWNFGDPASGNLNASTGLNPAHRYDRPGLYTVRLIVTDVYGCKDTMTKVDTISISNATARFTANPRSGCIPSDSSSYPTITFTDQSTSYVGSTIVAWKWHFGDGDSSILQNPTHQYRSPGSFDVTLIVTNSLGCTATTTQTNYITVRKPIADFNASFNLFCIGQPIQFNDMSRNTTAGTTYHWDFGDPTTNADTSNIRNPTYAYGDTGQYTVRLVIVDPLLGCRDSMIKQQLIRIDVPELRFVANDTFRYCPPHLVNFTNFANFDTVQVKSVLWSFGDNSYSTLFQPSYIYTQAGKFTVCLWIEFMNGCTDSICYPDYINIGGVVGNITIAPDSGCSPLTVCFNANSDSSVANHIWFFGDNNPWEQGGDTICHTYTEAGLYQPAVLLIDTQMPSCQYVLTYDDTIVVDSVIAGFYFASDTVCQNAPLQFTDSSKTLAGKPIVAWEWDFDDGTPIDTNQNPLHSFQTPGLKDVTLTAYSSMGCLGSITHQIFVWSSPTAAFDASDTIGCEELTVTFTDASVDGDAPITNWYWEFGDTTINGDTSIVQNPPPYFYGDTGTYIASLMVTDGNGCMDTAFQAIGVYPNPQGLANPDTVSICIYDTLQLLGDTSYVSYDWTPGTWLSDSTIARPYAVPLDTIDYELITTDQYGCFTIDSLHVIVNPLPTLTVSPYPDTAICEGQTVQLIAQGNGSAYVWSPAAGLDNPNSATPLATPAQTTTYEVYTVDSNGCNITDTVRIVVNRFFTNYLVERVCLGNRTDIVDLSSTSDLPITTWQWDFGAPGNADVSSVRSPNYTYPDSGNYTVTLVLTDVLGCTDTVQQIARVDHPAEPEAWPDTIICYGDAVQLTAIGGDTIYWTPAVDIDDPNSFMPTVSPQVTTTYVAHVTYGVCPFDTANVIVEVNPTPQLDVAPVFEILKGDSVVLETTTGLYDTIFWEPDTFLSCANCASPLSKPDTTITYTVTVIDSLGCSNTKTVTVLVEVKCSEEQIFVGNGFTPNGDGVNDVAYARLHGLKGLVVYRIFDRWGDLVFETNDAFTGWDGKNPKGEQLNSGVYVYIVEAECFSGQKLIKTGNVTIIN